MSTFKPSLSFHSVHLISCNNSSTIYHQFHRFFQSIASIIFMNSILLSFHQFHLNHWFHRFQQFYSLHQLHQFQQYHRFHQLKHLARSCTQPAAAMVVASIKYETMLLLILGDHPVTVLWPFVEHFFSLFKS